MADDNSDDLETVEDLTRPEHLVVWAMRVIALGHEDCPTLVRTFQRACGPYADQTLQSCVIFVKYLAVTSRRRLQVHVPGCLCLGEDEAAALAVLAASQQSLRDRDEGPLRQALAHLTGFCADESLVLVAQALGRLLEASRLVLPSRTRDALKGWPETSAITAQLH